MVGVAAEALRPLWGGCFPLLCPPASCGLALLFTASGADRAIRA